MTRMIKMMFCFLMLFASAFAMRNESRIAVTLVGSVFIRDGANPANHFVPQSDLLRPLKYNVVLGLPPRGLRWAMWRASSNPRMCIFGIQIDNEWYFMQVRKHGSSIVLVRQAIPDMVSPNSLRWFEYIEVGNAHLLYHIKSQVFVTTYTNQVKLTTDAARASDIVAIKM